MHSAEEMLSIAWPALLARAAADASVPDSALTQMIKDAHDHGVSWPHTASSGEPGEDPLACLGRAVEKAVLQSMQSGQRRLIELGERGEWKALPSTRKRHRMRRCIDRRFDGPKHLRTRNYDSDGEGCNQM